MQILHVGLDGKEFTFDILHFCMLYIYSILHFCHLSVVMNLLTIVKGNVVHRGYKNTVKCDFTDVTISSP